MRAPSFGTYSLSDITHHKVQFEYSTQRYKARLLCNSSFFAQITTICILCVWAPCVICASCTCCACSLQLLCLYALSIQCIPAYLHAVGVVLFQLTKRDGLRAQMSHHVSLFARVSTYPFELLHVHSLFVQVELLYTAHQALLIHVLFTNSYCSNCARIMLKSK